MVVESQVPRVPIAIVLVALSIGACTPGDDTLGVESDLTSVDGGPDSGLDPRIAAAQSGLALASAALDEQDPADGLAELLTAADLLAALSPTDKGFCEFGVGVSQIADGMLEQGAYSEARMAYAVAIHFADTCGDQPCGATACEANSTQQQRARSLRLRQQDARDVHQWALATAQPATGVLPPPGAG